MLLNLLPTRSRATLLGAACALLLSAAPRADLSGLPELGDSSAEVLSPEEGRELGQEVMRQLRHRLDFIQDPELQYYLSGLGNRIAVNADLHGSPLQFGLVNNPTLNAFAMPGAYITVFTGLVMATDSEDELAGVVAHEIAHLSQRHIPRTLARARERRLPAAAAMIAGLLIGGQVGYAALTTANAALLSDQLKFSRDYEREADAIGIKLLAEAGFDPFGMPNFFSKLERISRLQSSDVPEFLRTHPLSLNRLSEAEERAASFGKRQPSSNPGYLHARAKIRALYGSQTDKVIAYFRSRKAETGGAERDAAQYGLALALARGNRFKAARGEIDDLLARHPDRITYQIGRAEIDIEAGDVGAAVKRYRRLVAEHPEEPLLRELYAVALLENRQPAEARQEIRKLLRRNPGRYVLHDLLARATAELGQQAESHQARAEYLIAIGDYAGAMRELKQAERRAAGNRYLLSSVRARIGQIEERARDSEKQPRRR